MARIRQGVGIGQSNLYVDVVTIQTLLNSNTVVTNPANKLSVDGKIGTATIERIKSFQKQVVKLSNPDGVVSPSGITLRNLVLHSSFHTTTNKSKRSLGITEEQYVQAAKSISCEVAAIKAIVLTETPRGAFDEQGRPTILYERHYFHRLTKGKYDSNSVLSNKSAGGYGKYSTQYEKLNEALKLDKSAALQSASWGAFQIMGANYVTAGFNSVDDFVGAMRTLQGQLDAFVKFILHTPGLQSALQNKQWATFARIYNGNDYKKNNYDAKMARNYQLALKGY